ncbi:MAG: hypothetical protein MGAcid_13640 [uncultured Acidilobus sp. MG]|nr:MAG: hypothetical protein MGAcid_13640 [uncultured Acidilobus sp. MG]
MVVSRNPARSAGARARSQVVSAGG